MKIDLWKINLKTPSLKTEELNSYLNSEEQAKAQKFHLKKHRDRYIKSHAAMQRILSLYLPHQNFPLSYLDNGYGKPILAAESFCFNLSHSEDWAVLALSENIKVGVDLEKIKPIDQLIQLTRRFFHPQEQEEIFNLENDFKQQEAFFNLWTKKESYLKALGLGLSLPLESFRLHAFEEDEMLFETQKLIVKNIHFNQSYKLAITAMASAYELEWKEFCF